MTSLQQALVYLAGGGSVAVTTAFVSWLAENFSFWQRLQAWAKQVIMLVLPCGLSAGAVYAINNVPAATLAMLAPYFAAVMLAFAGVLAGQAWHQLVNKANPTLESVALVSAPAPKPSA